MNGLFDDLQPAAAPTPAVHTERTDAPPRNRIHDMLAGAAPITAPAAPSAAPVPSPVVAPPRRPWPAEGCAVLPIRTPRAPRPVPVTPRVVGFYRPKPRQPLFNRRELLHAAIACGAVAVVGITLARLVLTNW